VWIIVIKKTDERKVMKSKNEELFKFPEVGVPFLWPIAFRIRYAEEGMEALRKRIKVLKEVKKTHIEKPEPVWATKNRVRLDLQTLKLRDFSGQSEGIYTFVVAPYAGHTSMIVDFHKKQSLVERLMENGIERVCATDWKSATEEMKYYDIDNYLSELNVCVDELGGRVNLAGMCQGGWLCAMYAARFPDKVNTLIIAGSPIDTDAGEGTIKEYSHKLPMEFYEKLVKVGGGFLKGEVMLAGFKSLHLKEQYRDKFVELYDHIDDPEYVERFENFERWYEYAINLPGKWYLQVVRELLKKTSSLKENLLGSERS